MTAGLVRRASVLVVMAAVAVVVAASSRSAERRPSGTLVWESAFGADSPGAGPPFSGWEDTPWNIYGGASVSVADDPRHGHVLRAFGEANKFAWNTGGYPS